LEDLFYLRLLSLHCTVSGASTLAEALERLAERPAALGVRAGAAAADIEADIAAIGWCHRRKRRRKRNVFPVRNRVFSPAYFFGLPRASRYFIFFAFF
jgi:hypothetical protein